jgi:hypothetical protein
MIRMVKSVPRLAIFCACKIRILGLYENKNDIAEKRREETTKWRVRGERKGLRRDGKRKRGAMDHKNKAGYLRRACSQIEKGAN